MNKTSQYWNSKNRVSILFFPTVGSFIGLSLCPKRLHLLKFEGGIVIVMRRSILCLLNWFDLMNWMSKSTDSVSPGGIWNLQTAPHTVNPVESHMVCKAFLQVCTLITIFFLYIFITNAPTFIHINEQKLQWFMQSSLDTK